MAFNPTYEQGLAIKAKGNILVSAAAGSGKTAVLVERVIDKLCSKTESVPADKLLIVTFTNAAAAEMRTRIEKRLDEECRKEPENVSLLLQKHLLPSAKICTIDSFCIDLVRENFEKLGVSPDFKISDANSLKPINEAVLRRIIDSYLESKDPVFAQLLDIIGSEYDDGKFVDYILKIFNFSRQLPFPKVWFKSLADFYGAGEFNNNSVWWNYAFSRAEEIIKSARNSLAKALDLITVSEKAMDTYTGIFSFAADCFYKMEEKAKRQDWDGLFELLCDFSPLSLPNTRAFSGIYEVSAAKDIYKYVIDKPIEKLKKLFYADNNFINSQFEKIKNPMELLSEILIRFDDELFSEYKLNNTFTFHNIEHLALWLLCEEINGEISIREDAEELFNRFVEVMVDEYQDTNDLQDLLFFVLSNREKNLFVVGDIKQSIYGFRGANPRNFLAKKNKYIPIENASSNDPQKIILGNNFRCKREVCDFINYFFSLYLSEETGEIVYNEEECLIPAATFPETEKPCCEYHIIETKANSVEAIKIETRHIADYIRKTMAEGAVIKENDNELRKARFSDFAILLRSPKNKAPSIAQELMEQGIPANFSVEGFSQCTEIATILSLLKVIDNPNSDIDLLCVMLSPIFRFSAKDLAEIRILKRNSSLYSAVVFAAQNGNDKCKEFLSILEKYRILSVSNPLPKLISLLITETGYLDIVSVMTDGVRRRNNLLLLVNYAESFVASYTASLGGFVKYIIKQSEIGLASATASSGGDSVKIMSIHGSKGLQFPVCIIADLSTDFGDNEAKEATLYSTELGIGFKYFDEDLKLPLTTIGREVILDKTRALTHEEELRLLYVAMTRTQDRLLLVSTVSDIEKKVEALKTMLIASNNNINASLFARTKSYNDWILTSILLHPSGKELRGEGSSLLLKETKSQILIKQINEADIPNNSFSPEDSENCLENSDLTAALKENFSYVYPFLKLSGIESKASVSKLANSAESAKFAFSGKPSFMSKSELTASERGTAMHKVMQFFDFTKADDFEKELERLYEWQFISEKEYNSIDKKKLKAFLLSNIFSRIKNSSLVKREMRFITEVSAEKIAPDLDENLKQENIIVQGAVDICFEEADGIVILDFKTDRVDSLDLLVDSYGEQLNIYALACEKIFEKPVKQKLIYSFHLSDEIEVK